MTPASLKSAKKQLMGQLAIATDNAESQCLSMGKSLLFYGRIEPTGVVREKIEKIDSQQLHKIAAELLEREKMFTLIYS